MLAPFLAGEFEAAQFKSFPAKVFGKDATKEMIEEITFKEPQDSSIEVSSMLVSLSPELVALSTLLSFVQAKSFFWKWADLPDLFLQMEMGAGSEKDEDGNAVSDWIIKMKQYDTIHRFIKPKRVELANAQDRYRAKMSELKLK